MGDFSLKELAWPEGVPALILGGGGAVLILLSTHLPARISVMGSLLGLSAALLAVVFAALALVVSIPSERYVALLAGEDGNGAQAFLDPFLVSVGTQLLIVLTSLAYMLLAAHVTRPVEHAAFYVIGFLVVYGLLDIAGLARSLVRHGINRSVLAAAEGAADKPGADVRQLRRENR